MSGSPSKLYDRIGHFTTIPDSVIKMWPLIGKEAFALFVCLRYHSDKDDVSFPSYDTIRKETCLTRNEIALGIKNLMKFDLLERKKRFGQSTIYTLKLPPVVRQVDDCKDAPVVRQSDDSSTTVVLSVVRQVDTNKTHLTRLIQQDSLACDEKNCEGEEVRTKDDIKKMTEEALFNNMASRSNGGLDLSHYPEDVRPVIQELHILWGISPPSFKGNASKNSRAADWIAGARDLMMTCEEFGLPALERYRREHFEPYMATHKGLAPHTVSRPGSLINPIAGKIGEWRVQSREVSRDSDLPSAVYEIKGAVVSVGGRRFYNGKEIIDERSQENTTGI